MVGAEEIGWSWTFNKLWIRWFHGSFSGAVPGFLRSKLGVWPQTPAGYKDHNFAQASGGPISPSGLMILDVLKLVILTVLMILWLLGAASLFSTQHFQCITPLIYLIISFHPTLSKTPGRYVLLIACGLFNCYLIPEQCCPPPVSEHVGAHAQPVSTFWCFEESFRLEVGVVTRVTVVTTLLWCSTEMSEQSSVERNRKKFKGITAALELCN